MYIVICRDFALLLIRTFETKWSYQRIPYHLYIRWWVSVRVEWHIHWHADAIHYSSFLKRRFFTAMPWAFMCCRLLPYLPLFCLGIHLFTIIIFMAFMIYECVCGRYNFWSEIEICCAWLVFTKNGHKMTCYLRKDCGWNFHLTLRIDAFTICFTENFEWRISAIG